MNSFVVYVLCCLLVKKHSKSIVTLTSSYHPHGTTPSTTRTLHSKPAPIPTHILNTNCRNRLHVVCANSAIQSRKPSLLHDLHDAVPHTVVLLVLHRTLHRTRRRHALRLQLRSHQLKGIRHGLSAQTRHRTTCQYRHHALVLAFLEESILSVTLCDHHYRQIRVHHQLHARVWDDAQHRCEHAFVHPSTRSGPELQHAPPALVRNRLPNNIPHATVYTRTR